jgi:hypothetical protein
MDCDVVVEIGNVVEGEFKLDCGSGLTDVVVVGSTTEFEFCML